MRKHVQGLCFVVLWTVGVAAADSVVVTFSQGEEGWSGTQGIVGGTTLESTGGNPDHNLYTVIDDVGGITYLNNTSAEFLGDYTASPTVTLAIDVRVSLIGFFGSSSSRPWLVDLRDYDDPPATEPFVSVWYKFAQISQMNHGDWTHFEVTFDPSSETLPPGWGGSGFYNLMTGEPILPPGRTFRSVLEGVDEIAFTTYEPGLIFGFTDYEMRVDNIAITTSVAGPGEVPDLNVDRGSVAGDVVVSWSQTCGTAADYAVYEGPIGAFTGHTMVVCSDAGGDRSEEFTASAGDRYYLVVPLDATDEGSYGVDGSGVERPPAAGACRTTQSPSSCSPQ